jgi:hypothetical protein
MKKIRINELARELEVKAHEILSGFPNSASRKRRPTPAQSMKT